MIVVNKPKGLVVHPAPAHRTARWSTPCSTTAGTPSPASGGAAARHRPPDRPGHLRSPHRGEKRLRPPEALRPASGPHPGPDLPVHRDRESPGGQRHGGRPIMPPPGGPEEDGGGGGRPGAVTHWSVLERFPGYTYVECRLETGRTHQIGSTWRTSATPFWGHGVRGEKARAGPPGQCLHAVGLRFLHPGPGSWWSCGATCRRRSRPSCGSWRTEIEQRRAALSGPARCTRQPGVRRVPGPGWRGSTGDRTGPPAGPSCGDGRSGPGSGQKAPVGGRSGLPPVPPDVVPGKVAQEPQYTSSRFSYRVIFITHENYIGYTDISQYRLHRCGMLSLEVMASCI